MSSPLGTGPGTLSTSRARGKGHLVSWFPTSAAIVGGENSSWGWGFWGIPGEFLSGGAALGVSTWKRNIIQDCLPTSPGALLSSGSGISSECWPRSAHSGS